MAKEKERAKKIWNKAFVILVIAAFLTLLVTPPQLPQGNVKSFSSAEELKAFLNESRREQYADYLIASDATGSLTSAVTGARQEAVGAPGAQQKSDDYSTTNVQVQGVDEADIVKNDGKYIYTVTDGNIIIIDAYPAESANIISAINTSGSVQEIYINGDKLITFSASYGYVSIEDMPAVAGEAGVATTEHTLIKPGYADPEYYRPTIPNTIINIYDVSDRAAPKLERNLVFNGTYYDSRMIGDYVYSISNFPVSYYRNDIIIPRFSPTQTTFPEIQYFGDPYSSYTFTSVSAVNVKTGEINNKVFLLDYASNLFVSQDNIYVVYRRYIKQSEIADRVIDEVLTTVLPTETMEKINDIRKSGISDYEKQQKIGEIVKEWLALLGPEKGAETLKSLQTKYDELAKRIEKEREKSIVHKISIGNGNIEYKSKGEVPGHALNQFSMDEHDSYFRIATTTGNVWSGDSLNHIYVLDGNMQTVGKLEDLAPGEKIYSARFIGERAYMVTFKKVDPFYVIDLTDASSPKVLGFLKIPGFSDYLHPYDENHIIGVGKEAVDASEIDTGRRGLDFAWYQGLKVSLFDVSDVSNPVEKAKIVIGDRGTDSYALNDHRAFLFSKDKNLLVIPVDLSEIDEEKYEGKEIPPTAYGERVWQGAFVLDISMEGIKERGRITHTDETNKTDGYSYYDWRSQVSRSLYMGNTLYTISQAAVKANDLGTMEEIKKIALPYYNGYYGDVYDQTGSVIVGKII